MGTRSQIYERPATCWQHGLAGTAGPLAGHRGRRGNVSRASPSTTMAHLCRRQDCAAGELSRRDDRTGQRLLATAPRRSEFVLEELELPTHRIVRATSRTNPITFAWTLTDHRQTKLRTSWTSGTTPIRDQAPPHSTRSTAATRTRHRHHNCQSGGQVRRMLGPIGPTTSRRVATCHPGSSEPQVADAASLYRAISNGSAAIPHLPAQLTADEPGSSPRNDPTILRARWAVRHAACAPRARR